MKSGASVDYAIDQKPTEIDRRPTIADLSIGIIAALVGPAFTAPLWLDIFGGQFAQHIAERLISTLISSLWLWAFGGPSPPTTWATTLTLLALIIVATVLGFPLAYYFLVRGWFKDVGVCIATLPLLNIFFFFYMIERH